MKKKEGSRYEICVLCGKEWNVPKDLKLRQSGYVCPHCAFKVSRSSHGKG